MTKIALQVVGSLPAGYTGKILIPVDIEDEIAIGGRMIVAAEMIGKRATRTLLQNRSLHLYFKLLAKAFNDAGFDMTIVLKKLFKKPNFAWTATAIKEKLFNPVMLSTVNKDSTTKLNTNEVSLIHESLNRATATTMGISVPFPDRYSQMDESLGIK